MAQALDLGVGDAPRPDRRGLLSALAAWLETTLGHAPRDLALFERALTHPSLDAPSYERLEFLGDRVLGISMAEWLFELFPDEPEGGLSRRFNFLVSGALCAEVAREIGAGEHLRLNKQAYDDGARDSDYVLGDLVEALLGALYLEAGLAPARACVRRWWGDRVRREGAAKHPKAALQDWALANNRGMPAYVVTDETGPGHARRHTVAARLATWEASATASTKREAETEAARLLLAQIEAELPARRRKPRGGRPRAIVRTG